MSLSNHRVSDLLVRFENYAASNVAILSVKCRAAKVHKALFLISLQHAA